MDDGPPVRKSPRKEKPRAGRAHLRTGGKIVHFAIRKRSRSQTSIVRLSTTHRRTFYSVPLTTTCRLSRQPPPRRGRFFFTSPDRTQRPHFVRSAAKIDLNRTKKPRSVRSGACVVTSMKGGSQFRQFELSFDLDEFHFEDEGAVGGDVVQIQGSVAPLGGDINFPFIPFVHSGQGDLPAHDQVPDKE